jgi:HEAT repeat protein
MKRILVATLLAAGPAWAGNCDACTAKKLCAPHEAADDTAIKEAGAKLKNPDLLIRREGITELQAAGEKHLNGRSAKITNELARMLADREPTVKSYAAAALGSVGVETTVLAILGKETAAAEKALPASKPTKEAELKKWEADREVLSAMYDALVRTKLPAAATHIERGLKSSSYWVVELAAKNSKTFKGSKAIVKALVTHLVAIHANNPTEDRNAAWMAISKVLPEVTGCNDIEKQKDGLDATRFVTAWQRWLKENEGALK